VKTGVLRFGFAFGLTWLAGVPLSGCGSSGTNGGSGGSAPPSSGGQVASGGHSSSGGTQSSGGTTNSGGSGSGGAIASGGTTTSGGSIASGGAPGTGGKPGSGGSPAGTGGKSGNGGVTVNADAPQQPDKYVVAMVQSSKAQASELTPADVATLVGEAVTQAGGLDFIKDGQTVVLKPNLVSPYTDGGRTKADLTVNGISTDWRVAKAVADLVRAKNPKGKILVMEGSVSAATATTFGLLGYTKDNFGAAVDEFIAIEGASCSDKSTTALEQRAGLSGKQYWVNSRYVKADVVISLPTMKTHLIAGITGGVKNLAIGTTPVGQFSAGNMQSDCTRGQTADYIDHSGPEPLGAFIRDYYGIRPADFVVMDALQGLEHGPLPYWEIPPDGGAYGFYDYASCKKNMRLILAGKNAVAVDTIEALVMKCDPKKVPHLAKLAADGLGTTDTARITVVGKQVSEVAKPFAGKQTDICPGS
jgi:uncharacterized protein (DUF362 family)